MLSLKDCYPGQIVECIDAMGCPELTRGALYTIGEAILGFDEYDRTTWGVDIGDIRPPAGYRGFDPRRFRCLPPGRLAIFQAILQSVKQTERIG